MSDQRKRYLETAIHEDLAQKMVFLAGPRQIGKTTLAKMIGGRYRQPVYLNWDNRVHRKAILQQQWLPEADLLILDELHKHARWKNLIKGIWDTRQHQEHILVTGSSRLDIFRKGGDSLLGRYHHYRLHPFSLTEMTSTRLPVSTDKPPTLEFADAGREAMDLLFRFGGFPEPLFAASERVLRRWHRERFERVLREDIRETENVRSLSLVEQLGSMLPERVAAPLSLRSLSEDLEVSPKAVAAWMELLARNYYVFRVPPWHRRLARALKKESKYYLWDWSETPTEGARFENMVASHLLKWCHFQQDVSGFDVELYYVRDLEKREVDFLIVWEKQPWLLVECKLGGNYQLGHLNYFGERLGITTHRYMVSLTGTDDYVDKATGIRVIPAARFLTAFV